MYPEAGVVKEASDMLANGPWYLVGPLIGLLIVGLFWVANKPLGALGGYIDLYELARRPRQPFGFLLSWARLTDYAVIHNVLLLRAPDVFLLMGSAMAVSAVGTRLLRRFGARALVGGAPVSWSLIRPARNHVVGSALFGVGWAV